MGHMLSGMLEKARLCEMGCQGAWVPTLTQPWPCVILDQSLHLSETQFPHPLKRIHVFPV